MTSEFNLDSDLLDPRNDALEAPASFAACLNAHGMYETMRFVLRLSPRNHQLVDSISTGIHTASSLSPEVLQAYSTYLHETVHWWQHVGSTSGLIYSLAYPAQSHGSMAQLRDILKSIGPKKSLMGWAENAARQGMLPSDETLQKANIAVNNALDVEFYKCFTTQPSSAQELFANRYFESVGHCYRMAYGHLLGLLAGSVDPRFEHLPDARKWDAQFDRLTAARHIGHYHGSPIVVGRVGLHALFEGQARFIQLQFLSNAAKDPLRCEFLREQGYFDGIYGEAFEAYLKLIEAPWPPTVNDPLVGLFLLICDLSINPTRGLPLEINSFEDFILDVDPGIRFGTLCLAVLRRPELVTLVQTYSRDEYARATALLAEVTGYDHPLTALEAISNWMDTAPGVSQVMKEQESFNYDPTNLPVRVMFSHFVAFSNDKLANPEFFCWPGAWLAGANASEEAGQIFLRHLSLFSDKAEDGGVFPRAFPNKDPEGIKRTFNGFYAMNMQYDLTRQWILKAGAFEYEFGWLSKSQEPSTMAAWAKEAFTQAYGVNPDDFEVL